MSEDLLQQKCYIWFHNTFQELRGLLFHVPNGGSRNAAEAMKFKKIGVVPGVADMIFLYNKKAYFIEMKTETGVQSTRQKKWENLVKSQKFEYYICRSLKDFQLIILTILENELGDN